METCLAQRCCNEFGQPRKMHYLFIDRYLDTFIDIVIVGESSTSADAAACRQEVLAVGRGS